MCLCALTYLLLTLVYNTQASDVMLTGNLTNINLAYDDQVIVFRCIARGTILVWKSDDYIGSIANGRDLRLTFVDQPGHTERSPLVDGTVATVVSVTTVNGETFIESELRIRASLAISRSSAVTCTNNGRGGMNTTEFRVVSRMVQLTSNLTDGNVAYDDQVIIFRCSIRGTILVWKSDYYIGSIADGRDLRLTFVDPVGHTERSSLVGSTIARVVDVVDDIDGTLIVTELEIRASLSMRNASVTCTNNGLGRMNTTYFQVVEMSSATTASPAISTEYMIPMTSATDGSRRDSTTTDESVSDQMSGPDVGVAIGVSLFLTLTVIAVAIGVVIIIIVIFFKQRELKETFKFSVRVRKEDIESGREDQPVCRTPPHDDHKPPDVPKQSGSRKHENDPFGSEGVPGFPTYCDSKGGSVTLDPPVPPVGPQEDFRLTEAKEVVTDGIPQPQVSQGDPGTSDMEANPPAEEGEKSSSLGPQGPHGHVECDDHGLQEEAQGDVVPVLESCNSVGPGMLVVSYGAAHTSLPCEITPLEESYTGQKDFSSLPVTNAETANSFLLQKPGSTQQHPQSLQQTDTSDFDSDLGASINELDMFQLFPNNSTPLTSLRPDPEGGRFMISDSISDCIPPMNQLDSETGSRPSMTVSQDQLEIDLDTKCNKQIHVPEVKGALKEGADSITQSEADNKKSESVFHIVGVVLT